MSEYKKGDRVRVAFEAEIEHVFADGDLQFELVKYYYTEIPHEADFSIEKVEPPVVTFKPGDVVRHKSLGYTFALGRDGYLDVNNGIWNNGSDQLAQFISSRYELVTL